MRAVKVILIKIWIVVHSVLDSVIDLVFSYIYDDSKRAQIPTVKDSLLMESAVSLAEKIRNKEVILSVNHSYKRKTWKDEMKKC